MSRSISTDMVVASQGAVLSPALLVQITFASGTYYLWTGYGSITWGGNTFLGTGTLGKVDPATDTSDLSAQGVVFTLEGVDPTMLALAIGDVQQGLPAKMWLGIMSSAVALIADPVLIFSGLTDVCRVTDDGPTCTISLTCENKLARLSIPASRRFTADDQAIDWPGDRGFDFVPALQDSSITFG